MHAQTYLHDIFLAARELRWVVAISLNLSTARVDHFALEALVSMHRPRPKGTLSSTLSPHLLSCVLSEGYMASLDATWSAHPGPILAHQQRIGRGASINDIQLDVAELGA